MKRYMAALEAADATVSLVAKVGLLGVLVAALVPLWVLDRLVQALAKRGEVSE